VRICAELFYRIFALLVIDAGVVELEE